MNWLSRFQYLQDAFFGWVRMWIMPSNEAAWPPAAIKLFQQCAASALTQNARIYLARGTQQTAGLPLNKTVVRNRGHDFQIRWIVVLLVSVDVMDLLVFK